MQKLSAQIRVDICVYPLLLLICVDIRVNPLIQNMPELPEVEITVRDLQKKVLERTFIDVWTDTEKIIRLRQGFGGQVKKINFENFKKQIKGKKIEKIWRRAKNIIFELSGDYSLLIHQKLTGHLLHGTWNMPPLASLASGGKHGIWASATPGFLRDPVNRFLHVVFFLDNGKQLALSDLRKFAKVELWKTEELKNSKEFKTLGPEPLDNDFTFDKFKEILKNRKGKIKQVLMDQKVIAGIGNIYSDEILWEAKIHPFRKVDGLKIDGLMRIYKAIKKILQKAISLKGDSMSDYRLISGEKGGYQKIQKVYQREDKPCFRKDGGIIKRVKLGGRSAHFCPVCQLLTK